MALEDIFRALEEQAESECAELRRLANVQARMIREEAERQAAALKDEQLAAASEIGAAREERTIAAARLEGSRSLAAARERAFEAVHQGARERLASLRGTDGYEAVFAALLTEALSQVSGPSVIQVDPADASLAETARATAQVPCTVDPSIGTAGGMIVTTENGRVLLRNTFESRLERAWSVKQSHVAEILE
jgi:vacuolar-type H+-ATPase subunit E/Vma4